MTGNSIIAISINDDKTVVIDVEVVFENLHFTGEVLHSEDPRFSPGKFSDGWLKKDFELIESKSNNYEH